MSKAKVTLVGQKSVAPAITLSPQQLAITQHRNAPIIALGAPGTGKTTVLIHSALSRIAEGQNPDSILLITLVAKAHPIYAMQLRYKRVRRCTNHLRAHFTHSLFQFLR